jgi:glutaconate CoA-transferase, subunit A
LSGKITSVAEAIECHVKDGDCVFLGGFGQCIPFALGMELARQSKRELTICRSGADILFDMLIAAGSVSKVIFGYIGNPGIGLAHEFRRRIKAGQLEIEDWTNFSIVLRLHAGALGIPFIPSATLLSGDTPNASANVRHLRCPYTGERLSAIPALNPDVALIHAQRADAEGNVQLRGLPGDTIEGAHASRKIIATVEEIVDGAVLRRSPDRTIIPGFRVTSVALAPFGAFPSYVEGHYGRDDHFYLEYDRLARDPEKLQGFIRSAMDEHPDWETFVRSHGPEQIKRLIEQADPRAASSAKAGESNE